MYAGGEFMRSAGGRKNAEKMRKMRKKCGKNAEKMRSFSSVKDLEKFSSPVPCGKIFDKIFRDTNPWKNIYFDNLPISVHQIHSIIC